MPKLAINGANPVRKKAFPPYVTVGEEEKRAVCEVIDSGVLSGYLGTWSPAFYGGPRVQALERAWEEYFKVQHAVTVNSATSGLYAALNAEGIPIQEGYVEPLYLEPLYQKRVAFGNDGFAFTYPGYKGCVNYERGICPVTERMHDAELILTSLCYAGLSTQDLDDVVSAFSKVSDNLSELRQVRQEVAGHVARAHGSSPS